MQGYKHILLRGEIESGRINVARSAEEECMRVLGQIRDRPFNIFRSDGKLLLRSATIQRQSKKAGFRLNFGQSAFIGCSEGSPIWLRMNSDNDLEVQIGSSHGPILDDELCKECLPILENPTIENYWQAVTSACIILETRLRERAKASSEYYGARLIDYSLKPPQGKLVCRKNEKEQEGVFHLCRGVSQGLRNPSVHLKQNSSRTRARQVVGIIDMLLGEIDAAEIRST
ncbi:MAG: TIGR02391 family protein [Anaerolineales bacterium]